MGLFSKEKCILCGNEVGAMSRTKLNDGTFLCSNCVTKTGVSQGFTINNLKGLSPNKIRERIEYHENDVKKNTERIKKFNATYQVGNYVWFDDNHKWFAFPQGTFSPKISNSYIFKYDEIVDFEVLEDGTAIIKGGLGKALVGGVIFGLPGIIAGATSKKIKEVCNKLEIKITTRNIDIPVVYVNLINMKFKKSSFVYKTVSKSVQNILSKFKIIVDGIEQEKEIINESTSSISVADEIKKFKELLDMGAITQEEFDTKKKELLKL